MLRSARWMAALAVAAAVVTSPLVASPAHADAPLHVHDVVTTQIEGDQFLCGDLLLTATGGTQVEKTVATAVHGLVHINIVRSYHGLTFAGSDGHTYRAAATAHQTVLIALEDIETGEPISTREVIHVRFIGGNQGSPGYLHEVFTIRSGQEQTVTTGTCDYA